MKTDTLFLTLNIFSATGGIEKVCRVAGKAMYEKAVQQQQRLMIWSMHDKTGDAVDNPYFPLEYYRCFNADKKHFVLSAVKQGLQANTIILSHINLLLVARLVKTVSPDTRIILMAHGIEIWDNISAAKEKMLRYVDEFWAVSHYTRQRMMDSYPIAEAKIKVLNNCLDPFLPMPKNIHGEETLCQRYGIAADDKIIFTLSRLSSSEKYKGYMDVISALAELKNPGIKYIIAGRADEQERQALQQKIAALGLSEQVILAGFISETELAAHFKMSDCYIMPSSKEGFGIVFIEAMYYGVPVIGGNADGSMDALQNGELGIAVTPGDVGAIKAAIVQVLYNPEAHVPDPHRLSENFSYNRYQDKLGNLLSKQHFNVGAYGAVPVS